MNLTPGTRLGPYTIGAALGAGGMGRVYRARDTRLGREVAIKVLPPEVADDPQRLRRFEQEARAASTLNHPNILTVHDVGRVEGVAFLVTELLRGETLREQVRRGPLPATRAVDAATAIAQGLVVAHREGIVHRDIKPENVFVTESGVIKILDFGLARVERAPVLDAGGAADDVSTIAATAAGMVLGTPGYMAPEQLRGAEVDARADLFALGCVLFELLVGRAPFRRGTTIESLHAILTEPAPDIETLVEVPPVLARVVERLLEKEPARRFQTAADVVFALEQAALVSGAPRRSPEGARRDAPVARRPWPFAIASGLLGAVVVLVVWATVGRTPPTSEPVRFELSSAGGGFSSDAESHNLALSPDGRVLAYVAEVQGRESIWLRTLDSTTPRELAGTEEAHSLFWSPDGATLAFFAGGNLKRVPRNGGPVQIVCATQGSTTGSWGSSGTIVFSQGFGPNNGLFRVAAAGGTPERLTSAGDLPRWIEFLPDGRHYLYWDRRPESMLGGMWIGDLEHPESGGRPLLDVSSRMRYAPPGWLVYFRSGALVAQRFDAASLRLSGEPIALVSDVPYFFNGWSAFSVGGAAALAFQVRRAPEPLVWLDRHGRELGRVGPAARYVGVRLAPDARAAAVTVADPISAFTDVWLVDIERGGSTRLSDEPYLDWAPVWSPDGEHIAYTTVSLGPGFTVTVRRVVDGAKIAAAATRGTFVWPRAWRNEGLYLDASAPSTGWDLLRLDEITAQPHALHQTDFREALSSPSPDGRWLAFHTTRNGEGELELLRLDGPARPIRVDRARAVVPRWRADGRELYFVSPDRWLTAIGVSGDDPPSLGASEPLFPIELVNEDSIDVTPDGQRFLVAASLPSSALPITIALDWQRALEAPRAAATQR